MSENYVMSMAKFIHGHPELQMQPPRVWRMHYEDECQQKNKIYAFSSLKQYSSLVRIQKSGRYHVYGSAKIPAKVLPNQPAAESSRKKATSDTSNKNRIPKATTTATVTTDKNCQLELDYTAESALKEIEQIMLSASQKIQQVVRRTSSSCSQVRNQNRHRK